VQVELILDVVPRTAVTPDGLQVAEYRNAVPAQPAAEPSSRAP